ncbi:MAG: methionyl-tRNA formyltransferase [Gammaproteobacteria bacterium RIFCSPHIGHO2_12_FULL_45_12]|nr:MAG: methionyl-tRNA formyltransferase [Gammaproteobacteria bacterium RIFCSPHIGHO2_12_FULL_45_12]
MISLKMIFAGTPEFAAVALQALIHSPHQLLAVYTQPDRPAGRGLKLTSSPVKQLARQHELPVYQPASLKTAEAQADLSALQADMMVVAAYGMLLPEAVLTIPRLGCINIHPSLLPRWRGAAPIQRTVLSGDTVTGVTIMQMEAGLDTGPILLQHRYTLAADETSQTLHDKMAAMGAEALLEALNLLAQNVLRPQPQDNQQATYASKISKEEAWLDWTLCAQTLEHKVRAFIPWPIACANWRGQRLRIWQAKAMSISHGAMPGTLLHASREGIDIATAEGALRLLQMQLAGGKVLPVQDFYHARKGELMIGELFS